MKKYWVNMPFLSYFRSKFSKCFDDGFSMVHNCIIMFQRLQFMIIVLNLCPILGDPALPVKHSDYAPV